MVAGGTLSLSAAQEGRRICFTYAIVAKERVIVEQVEGLGEADRGQGGSWLLGGF